MKKIILITTIILCLGISAKAQNDGFFSDYNDVGSRDDTDLPMTPNSHGLDDNVNAPIGNGLLILTLLGVGYALKKS